MKKYIFAVVATLFYSHAYSQVADDTPVSKSSHNHKVAISHQRINQPTEKQAPLPVLSKESASFCQSTNYAANPNYDMMAIFLQQGADINAICDQSNHMTALFQSLTNNWNPNFQLADWLIQHGADINIPTNGGNAQGVTIPMMVAVGDPTGRVNQKELDYLVQHGANFHSVDSTGRTALQWFKPWNLIGYPTNTGYPDISLQTIAFIDQLIVHGIDVNHQDKSGNTALMNAVVNVGSASCSPEAVKLLLSHGANITLKNKLGKSALDLAMDRAAQASQGSPCNEVVKTLYNPQQISKSFSAPTNSINNSTSANSVGTYGGTVTGDDEGIFQADINQDGTATFHGHSNKIGMTYTHSGKVGRDGSVTFSSADAAVVFTGNVSRDGIFSGTWRNSSTGESGSFQGKKDVQVAIPSSNLLKAFGSLFK